MANTEEIEEGSEVKPETVAEITAQLEEIRQDLDIKEVRMQELQDDCDKLTAENEELKAKVNDLIQDKAAYRTLVNSLRADIVETVAGLGEVKDRLQEAMDNLAVHLDEDDSTSSVDENND